MMIEKYQFSIKHTCHLLGLHRSAFYYEAHPLVDEHIRIPLRELAQARPRFGSRRLHILLMRQGVKVGKNRLQRIYKEEGLGVRFRLKKKRKSHLRIVPPVTTVLNLSA